MESSHPTFSLLIDVGDMNLYVAAKCSIQINTVCIHQSVGLLSTMKSVRFQPATAHDCKCLFHEYVGEAQ